MYLKHCVSHLVYNSSSFDSPTQSELLGIDPSFTYFTAIQQCRDMAAATCTPALPCLSPACATRRRGSEFSGNHLGGHAPSLSPLPCFSLSRRSRPTGPSYRHQLDCLGIITETDRVKTRMTQNRKKNRDKHRQMGTADATYGRRD